jgi:hypothetical protein
VTAASGATAALARRRDLPAVSRRRGASAIDASYRTGAAKVAKRFPALKDMMIVEARVCQVENSANGDFIIDGKKRRRPGPA